MKAVAALNKLADEVIAKKPVTEYGQSHMAVTKIHAGIAVNNYARRAEICIDRPVYAQRNAGIGGCGNHRRTGGGQKGRSDL